MKRFLLPSRLPQFLTALAAFWASMPALVQACPMCFAGGAENKDAFLYGSLFLMFVPVASLGGLGFWAYRRIKAIDGGLIRPVANAPDAPQSNGGSGVVLHIGPRRQ